MKMASAEDVNLQNAQSVRNLQVAVQALEYTEENHRQYTQNGVTINISLDVFYPFPASDVAQYSFVTAFSQDTVPENFTTATLHPHINRCAEALDYKSFFIDNYNSFTIRGLELIAAIFEIHTSVNGLSTKTCKLMLPKNKNLPTGTHYRELHRQESILKFVRGLPKTDQIALYTVMNKIVGVVSYDWRLPGDQRDSWIAHDEALRKDAVFKVSRSLWALLVGPYWLAKALDEGCVMDDFFHNVENDMLRNGDQAQLDCMRWFAARLELWGWTLKAKYCL